LPSLAPVEELPEQVSPSYSLLPQPEEPSLVSELPLQLSLPESLVLELPLQESVAGSLEVELPLHESALGSLELESPLHESLPVASVPVELPVQESLDPEPRTAPLQLPSLWYTGEPGSAVSGGAPTAAVGAGGDEPSPEAPGTATSTGSQSFRSTSVASSRGFFVGKADTRK
jgi:hypothetical protein